MVLAEMHVIARTSALTLSVAGTLIMYDRMRKLGGNQGASDVPAGP